MRYLGILLASAALAAPLLLGSALLLAPAPIAAEYWVREMLVVKRHIAKQHEGRRKLLVASGSATLFGIDTAQLGRELGVAAINLGLHAALPLRSVLEEAARAASPGDAVILALEESYYCRSGTSAWQARNLVAWQPERWRDASIADRLRILLPLGPEIIPELVQARVVAMLFPAWVEERMAAMDDARVLARFASANPPSSFAYSALHLDALGNMQATHGPGYSGGPGPSPEIARAVCAESAEELRTFASEMRRKGVAVYFASTPAVDTGHLDRTRIADASRQLAAQLAPHGKMLDSRADVVFARLYFFNSYLHLNARGRAIRTRVLAEAIRRESELLHHLRSEPAGPTGAGAQE